MDQGDGVIGPFLLGAYVSLMSLLVYMEELVSIKL